MQFQVVQQLVCTHWVGSEVLQHPQGMHEGFTTSVPKPPPSIVTVTSSDGDSDIGIMSTIASSVADEPACAMTKNNRATTMDAILTLRAMV
jgi:hypothetical protein